jgi:hypothetical protein
MAYDSEIYNSIIDEVVNILLEVKDEIQAEMAAKNINASGRTSAGMQVQRYESGVRLVLTGDDVAPLATLEVGRQGGKVPMGFTDIIERWSRDKGLQFADEKDRRRFSYLTARKIAREGTHRHKMPTDVYSGAVVKGMERLRKTIKAELTQYIHETLINR